jgi:prevent-host-death family protein
MHAKERIMYITATELKSNLGKYLELVMQEAILITKNGKTIAKLVTPNDGVVEGLRGVISLPDTVDYKTLVKEARTERYDNSH